MTKAVTSEKEVKILSVLSTKKLGEVTVIKRENGIIEVMHDCGILGRVNEKEFFAKHVIWGKERKAE